MEVRILSRVPTLDKPRTFVLGFCVLGVSEPPPAELVVTFGEVARLMPFHGLRFASQTASSTVRILSRVPSTTNPEHLFWFFAFLLSMNLPAELWFTFGEVARQEQLPEISLREEFCSGAHGHYISSVFLVFF